MKYIKYLENFNENSQIIVDSNISLMEATEGIDAPVDVLSSLILLNVDYISSDKMIHRGQIVVNKTLASDVVEFFQILLKEGFIVEKVIPIVKYNWDDNRSMQDNNSSGFNWRRVEGQKKLSKHSYGNAIDINPFWNPVYYSNGKVSPNGATRDTKRNGVFLSESKGVLFLKSKGWKWGGDWTSLKDWHHFQKG
jgi:peptidoglycan L-alanyl-D-glutamate endopeptidase CwlK